MAVYTVGYTTEDGGYLHMYYCSPSPQQTKTFPSTKHHGMDYPMQNTELLLDRIKYIYITETGKISV
jgi:hypothetical protein